MTQVGMHVGILGLPPDQQRGPLVLVGVRVAADLLHPGRCGNASSKWGQLVVILPIVVAQKRYEEFVRLRRPDPQP